MQFPPRKGGVQAEAGFEGPDGMRCDPAFADWQFSPPWTKPGPEGANAENPAPPGGSVIF